MKECFVPIEVCKKLAAKGYDGRKNGKCVEKISGNECEDWDDEEMMWYDVIDVKTTPRIHIYDALKWLEEKKHIYVISVPYPAMSTIDRVMWYYEVKYHSDGVFMDVINSLEGYMKSEEAAIAGIERVLDNFIEEETKWICKTKP